MCYQNTLIEAGKKVRVEESYKYSTLQRAVLWAGKNSLELLTSLMVEVRIPTREQKDQSLLFLFYLYEQKLNLILKAHCLLFPQLCSPNSNFLRQYFKFY